MFFLLNGKISITAVEFFVGITVHKNKQILRQQFAAISFVGLPIVRLVLLFYL